MQQLVTWFGANKRDLQTMLAALAMVLILVYTFWHTAALLASYVTPQPVGWIAALGIEAQPLKASMAVTRAIFFIMPCYPARLFRASLMMYGRYVLADRGFLYRL